MMRKSHLIFLAAAGLAAAIFWLEAPHTSAPGPEIGSAAPGHQWTDLSGQSTALSHYRGRVVLLDFWATWCTDCREEQPALKRLYGIYHGRGFELLAPSLDRGGRKDLVPYLTSHP